MPQVALWGQPPNRRLQLTPLAASEIVAILKTGVGSTVISIYHCGATEAQHVGPPFCNALLWCSSCFNASAPCSLVCAMPSRMPTPPQCYRVMLYRMRNAVVHAHPLATPSHHAHLYAQRHPGCPSNCIEIAPCSIVYATPSCMPIWFGRHRVMACRVRNAVAHAHPLATPSQHAQSCAQRGGLTRRVAQQPHVADAATRRARSLLF